VHWIYVYFHDPLSWQSDQYAKLFTKYGVNIVHHGDKHRTYWTYPIQYDVNAADPSPVLAPPGRGFKLFEAGVGCYLAATWPHMEGMRQHMAVMKMEFTGKVLKVTVAGTATGATSGTWNAITLRNGKVAFDAVSASPDNLAVGVNGTASFKVSCEFSDGTSDDITDPVLCDMTSLDPGIATVADDGTVTGVSLGTTRIIVKSTFERTGNFNFDKSDTITVNVAPGTSVEKPARAVVNAKISCLPNPCRSAARISWTGNIGTISVYSANGRLVERIFPRKDQSSLLWTGRGAKSGVYFVRAAGMVKKLLVIR
jgi:hypothetical protein